MRSGKGSALPIAAAVAAALAALLVHRPALASDNAAVKTPWERFSLKAGGFLASLDSEVRLGSTGLGTGVDVDVEDAFGLESSGAVLRAEASYRMGQRRRHRLDLSWFAIRREGTNTLTGDITIGDNVIVAGTSVDSRLNLQVYRLAYTWSFYQDDRADIAIGIGAYVAPVRASVSATGETQGSADFTAPLPTLSLRLDFALTPKVFIRQSLNVFYMEYESFKGGLLDTVLAVEYNPWEHFGFGLGYNAFRIALETKEEDYPAIDLVGRIDFIYQGLLLYGKLFY